mgnify:CR=1 FL=1
MVKFTKKCKPIESLLILCLFIFGSCSTNGKHIKEIPTLEDASQVRQDGGFALERPHFIISPGDEIAIIVYRHEDLNRRLLIPPDGNIFFPLVGELNVSDMSAQQIRKVLSDGLSKYIVGPQINVDVVSIKSQRIYVLGEVHRPGVFQIDGEMDLIEAISKAGGFTDDAKPDKVFLIRGNIQSPKIQEFDIEKALDEGDLTQNTYLQKKDIVYVPASYISNVDDFFRHFENIIRPFVLLEQGIVLYPRVENVLSGEDNGGGDTQIIITPTR